MNSFDRLSDFFGLIVGTFAKKNDMFDKKRRSRKKCELYFKIWRKENLI